MLYKTLSEIRDIIQREMDLQEETFVDPVKEMPEYINQAINFAEAEIINLHQDYYLTSTEWQPLTESMELPEDIYANRIRRVEVRGGTNVDQVFRAHNLDKFSENGMRYIILNAGGMKPKIKFNSTEGFSEARIWYIRNANRLASDSDVCDLPEIATDFIVAFVKAKVYEKEKLFTLLQSAKQDVAAYRELYQDTLQSLTDDNTDMIQPDFSFYEDSTI